MATWRPPPSRALSSKVPPCAVDDGGDDGEPETGAGVRANAICSISSEGLWQLRSFFWGNDGTSVFHNQTDLGSISLGSGPDPPSRFVVPNRVVDHVFNHATEQSLASYDRNVGEVVELDRRDPSRRW